MAQDRVSLTDGYSGAQQKNRAIGDQGASVDAMAKKQHGHTESFMAANKGALASQGANGSTATANSLTAGGNLHTVNADNSQRYLKQMAGHEDSASHTQAGDSRSVETSATDWNQRINSSQA